MKLMKKAFLIIVMAMVLCACTGGKKEEENKVPVVQYDLKGKTFYNTVDNYGNEDHSKVWFGSDGSFVMIDNFFNGSYEINGEWSLSENVVTLNVKNTQVGTYSKIIFEVQDDDTLKLITSLEGSKDGDTFSTTEVKGAHGQTSNSEFKYTIYYNASQDSKNKSNLQLMNDGAATIIDQNDFGIVEANGTFEIENGYMISVRNFQGVNPFDTPYVEFQIYDENTLILMTDLGCSRSGDVFSTDGTIPEALQGPMGDSLGNYHSKWRFSTETDVNELYLPTVEFDSAGMFTFTENVYSGMAQIIGWYEKNPDGFVCHVDDNHQMMGFAGYDVETIEFKKQDENTLILKTDICMSRDGDSFALLP